MFYFLKFEVGLHETSHLYVSCFSFHWKISDFLKHGVILKNGYSKHCFPGNLLDYLVMVDRVWTFFAQCPVAPTPSTLVPVLCVFFFIAKKFSLLILADSHHLGYPVFCFFFQVVLQVYHNDSTNVTESLHCILIYVHVGDEKGQIIVWRYAEGNVFGGCPAQDHIFSMTLSYLSEGELAVGWVNVKLNCDCTI